MPTKTSQVHTGGTLHRRILVCLALALFASILVGASVGPYTIAPWRMWDRQEVFLVLAYIRFPRVLLGCLVGASLAVAGASLQGLFRNPLADSGLLGINAGAGLGAALCIVLLGQSTFGFWGVPIAAFLGAWGVTWMAWRLAQSGGRVMVATLLLAGIALNSFAGAGIGLMTYLADEQQLRDITFWLLGGLGGATWWTLLITFSLSCVGITLQLRQTEQLNLMTLGERDAYHMGVDPRSLKRHVILGVTISVAGAVSAAGGIGFIGLVVPHLLRLWGGADHRFLLPASAFAGAILLVLADVIAKMVLMPAELPVGIVTALLGAPFLAWLLFRNDKGVLYA